MVYLGNKSKEVEDMNGKIKIKKHKSDLSINSPKFTIEIEQAKSQDLQILNNYEVLTNLIGTSDIVISLDSGLMNLPRQKRQPLIQKFLESIRAMDLEYKYLKSASHQPSQSILSILFKEKNTEDHEILTYIPNEIWMNSAFQDILPFYGARYFITKNNKNSPSILDDMQCMTDDEKLEYFKLIVFNCIYINSMGICSKYISLPELEEILNIQHNAQAPSL